jgi:hypothetical protein
MATYKEITDFLIIHYQGSFELYIKKKSSDDLSLASVKDQTYLIGYKENVNNNSITDGEFIKIVVKDKKYELKNDYYGALSIYKVIEDKVVYFSTSLPAILGKLDKSISLDYDRLHRYFAFGYQLLEDKSHFDKVEVLQEPINIKYEQGKLSIHRIERDNMFANPGSPSFEENYQKLESAILRKISKVDRNKMLFCMTGGKDSILSGLVLRKNKYFLNTGTFGDRDSMDLKFGKIRTHEILKSKHNSYCVDDLHLDTNDFFRHANFQSGFGTFGSIYFTKYFEEISKLGITHVLFSDHYEATRQMPRTISDIRKKYFTPPQVVNEYFLDKESYGNSIERTMDMIEPKYGENAVEKWYFFDRNVRGQQWKSPLTRNLGLTKINLAYDYEWINTNYNYLKNHGFIYEKMMKYLLHESGLDGRLLTSDFNPIEKDIAISPQLMVYQNSTFFLELLDFALGYDIAKVFDINKLIFRIQNRELADKDEWFILRLLNLIAFSNQKNMSLNFS